MFSLWGKYKNSGSSLYTLQGHKSTLEIIPMSQNISWSMPGKITEALHCWEEAGVHAKNRNNWRIVPAAIRWTIWKKRNLRV